MSIDHAAAARREAARQQSGEFGHQARTAPVGLSDDTYLAPVDESPPEPNLARKGTWHVADASSTTEERDGFVRTTIHMGGRPDLKARNLAAAHIYEELSQADATAVKVDQLCAAGKPMTLLKVTRNGDVEAVEGRGAVVNGRPFQYAKGSSTKGYYLDQGDVIDVTAGFGGQQGLSDTFRRRAAQFVPAVERIAMPGGFDDLPEYDPDVFEDEDYETKIAAVYLITHPGISDGPVPGCLFFATDKQTGDGPNGTHIINGQFWAPGQDGPLGGEGGLTSESSSFYSGDLARLGGKVTDYVPGSMTFKDSWADMPSDRVEAYRRILGKDNI